MTSGIPKHPPLCKRCGVVRAKKVYCDTCKPIVTAEKKRAYKINNTPLGLLLRPGIKRAPSLTIIDDPLPFGGFPVGTKFEGKVELTSMLANWAFTDNTIVEAAGRRLRIVNNKFVLDIE
jgi:hypothetical protein